MVMTIFQGSLGSGKSASMVLDCIEHLERGGVCAANFGFLPGWAETLAARYLSVRLGIRDGKKIAHDYWSRFMSIGDVGSLWKASDILIPRCKGKVAKQYEGRGRLYIDEAQLFFNSRAWKGNDEFIHFFSQSRKLKWDIIIVAHDVSMIDKQIRNFLEYEYRFRNMQKIKIPIIGIPLSPVPCFLGIQRYAGRAAGAGQVISRKLYPFFKFASNLYDSSLVFQTELITDPVHCGPDPQGPVRNEPVVIKTPKSPSFLCPGW